MRHPCGNLPLTSVHAHLHYCHHHQAWFATVERILQEDDDPRVVSSGHIDFGPFDRLDDVLGWLGSAVPASLALPGGPWVL